MTNTTNNFQSTNIINKETMINKINERKLYINSIANEYTRQLTIFNYNMLLNLVNNDKIQYHNQLIKSLIQINDYTYKIIYFSELSIDCDNVQVINLYKYYE